MTKLITVHGTGAGAQADEGALWWQKGSPFMEKLGQVLDLSRVDVVPFHWGIGDNSEQRRRKAGEELHRLLRRCDEEGQDYYLIGHSHGGSVIYNALLTSSLHGRPLARLQAWCTIGAPFIDIAPKRFLFTRLDAPGLAVYMIGVMTVLVTALLLASHLIGSGLAREFDAQVRTIAQDTPYAPMLAVAVLLAFLTYSLLFVYERITNKWRSDRIKRRTAELYAATWIGMSHQDDEAISSLRAATSFKPEIVPRDFLALPFSLLPLAGLAAGLVWLVVEIEDLLGQPRARGLNLAEQIRIALRRAFESLQDGMPGLPWFAVWLVALVAIFLIATLIIAAFRHLGGFLSRPAAAAIDRIVWSSVRERAWGDDLLAENVRGVSSHPPLFAPRYKPLSEPVAGAVSALSDENAGATLKKLRANLGMTTASNRSSDFLTTSLNQLNWRELIHTAYFDVDQFVRLVAFALHRQGLAGLRADAWTNAQREGAREALLDMTISQIGHKGEVVRVGYGRSVSDAGGLDLSVAQKTLVSVGMLAGLLLAGFLLTTLVVPWHWAGAVWLGGAVLTVVLAEVLPVSTLYLVSRPDPAASFEAAMQRFTEWAARDEATIHPRCTAYVLQHGRRTSRCYVLVHGISNCPYSMVDFAPKLHALGHNVVVMRMPQNGHLDNATDALKRLTARQLRAFADASIDIAAGLGERVHVIGISAGGVIAGWMAQNRSEIDRAVLLAPAYGLSSFGTGLNNALMRLVLLVPNFSVWKDPIRRAAAENRPHSYKRQATRGMGEVMRLGLATVRQAEKARPSALSITLVTNAADAAVDPTMPDELAKLWERHATPVARYVFPKELNLPHELIDPTEDGANTAISHPKIIELAERPPEVPRRI